MDTVFLLGIAGLGTGALYFLLGSGLSLIVGLMRILNFAHGAILAGGAFAGWMFVSRLDTPSMLDNVLALLCAALVAAVLAVAMEVFLLRRLFGKELEQLLLTVGVSIALVALMQGIWGPDERPVKIPYWLGSVTSIRGVDIPNDRFLLIAVACIVYVVIQLFLRYTRHGLIVRSAVENREMVEALGIDVRKSFTLVFAIGGSLAGIAGGLQAVAYRSVTPTMGNSILIFSFIVLIIGGLGSITGTLLAATIVGLLQSFANFYISLGIGDVLVVALLTVVLIVRPEGLLGEREGLT